MTIIQLRKYMYNELSDYYPETEIQSFFYRLTEVFLTKNRLEIALASEEKITPEIQYQFTEAIARLKHFEPIQYILSHTEFFGMKFHVSPDVLIPRPETEELIYWILEQTNVSDTLSILDIGTGSGCIAVSLAKQLPNARISAIDLSTQALRVAQKNALDNQVSIEFHQADILEEEEDYWKLVFHRQRFDLIVSNPPYVLEKEKTLMHNNVLQHEPNLALFVPNEDALLFYRKICRFSQRFLNPNGTLFFEVNEAYGDAVVELLSEWGFLQIEKKKDIYGKDRMVCGKFS